MSTLGVIRGNVRRNLGETTPNFYTNAELNQFISEAYKKYTQVMIDEGDGWFVQTVGVGFTVNNPQVSTAALVPSFISVSRLEKVLSNGSTKPMRAAQRRFSINSNLNTGVGDAYIPDYLMQSRNIILEPTPQYTEAASSTSGLKLDYNYLPTFPDALSADAFSFDAQYPITFEPLIELYATIAGLESKDGMGGVSDIQSFRNRLLQWEQTFTDSLERSEYPDSVSYVGNDYRSPFYYR